LPSAVIARARVVLEALEKGDREGGATQKALIDDLPLFAASPTPVAPMPAATSPALEKLNDILPDDLSPKEALNLLYELKELAQN
jgi:DNA mismatch repair protein MutS